MAVVSKNEILQHLESIDLNELLDRMEAYVRTRFYSKSEKLRKGFDYLDFCNNVLAKACLGVRNWDKEKSTFEEFIFGSLKSDLYNFFRKQRERDDLQISEAPQEREIYLIEINDYIDLSEIQQQEEPPDIDFNNITEDLMKSLKEQDADKIELGVFECWLAGYEKPKEIAELCGVTTTDINNAVKRLSRKRIKLQEKWISLKKY
ncbi:hypothetical protein MWU78_09240 [Arenibacter sp. F26102]|uniref:hypothetical protein n=1 Tax=Arenibacter sp. F26102 TaxID=2926416 RepID=UPI001FF25E66|nr:hypothetical protein [Arenibacter sp. F26102]MCK0145826.1 hypothetical protein [Arenibacter sp. F26102]